MKDLIIFGNDMIGDENPWDAPEVELWVGSFKGSDFILGRVYEGEYEGDDGETYYQSFSWDFHEPARDEAGDRIDVDVIVELIDFMDYDFQKSSDQWDAALDSLND